MSIAEGYATWTDRETGKLLGEAKTLNCSHCQRMIIFQTNTGGAIGSSAPTRPAAHDPGGRCPQCDAAICGPCCDELAKTLKCVPFEKRLEAMESGRRLCIAAGVLP